MQPKFVHLHVHSEYSIYDSVLRLDDLMEACAKQRMPAVALTDLANLFGLVKFYKEALSFGIKPIFGSEIWLEKANGTAKLLLLCQNAEGLNQLRKLLSKGYLKAKRALVPLFPTAWLQEHAQHLIAILLEDKEIESHTQQHDFVGALAKLQELRLGFAERFYIGLTRIQKDSPWKWMLKLAERANLPVVATNAVCFLTREDFEAHEARVCIQEGTTLNQPREKKYSPEQYLKSQEAMCSLFSHVPSALENSVEIAKRCNVALDLGKVYLPNFPVPSNETIESCLEKEAQTGLDNRFSQSILKKIPESLRAEKEQIYRDRLQLELQVINTMGFAGYFLIVADFIRWAKQNDIPVGPGRGSGAGSLVAYALDITDLDPLEYDLLFERFLNPERISLPDFDIDFCMDKRDLVIEYVAERYGRKSVSQIATFGTMAAKAVVRDVGRVLGHPYGYVDKIAKLIPFEIGMTLDKALQQEETLRKLYQSEEEVKTLLDLAKKLEGLTRNVGKHAGGVVIAPNHLTDFTPLYCEEGSNHVVTQFDKDDVEAIGLVKFDFLGLRTLTIIHWAVQFVNKIRASKQEPLLRIEDLPLDDKLTYDLLKKCQTTAIFQLESRGMKDLIHRLQPDHFEEIIALVALFRPGPLQSGMVDDFINRKHGRSQVEYPHAALEPILKPTYGVILYQEQVMQIAQTLAGFTLAGADLLRRAMGKKKVEEMAEQRAIFVKGAVERGVNKELATHIFDLMEKFAGYGFNKSHSAAYALVSYQTAWLKAHYPNAFMAAVLSSDMANTDKVVNFVQEVKQLGLKLLHPCVNRSDFYFTLDEDGAIIYGLGAIKGVGEGAIHSIVQARQEQVFSDLFDFCRRIETKRVNRRVLEALVKSGSMDCFGVERSTLFASIDAALFEAEKVHRDDALGQPDMFTSLQTQKPKWHFCEPLSAQQRLRGEKETLGLYVTGHPMDTLREEFSRFITHSLQALPMRESKVVVAGIINQIRTLQTKRGDRMAFVTLDDNTGTFEIAIFADLYQKRRTFLNKDEIVIVSGLLSVNAQQIRFRAEEVLDLPHAREKYATRLRLTIKSSPQIDFENWVQGLQQVLQEEKGHCRVAVDYYQDNFHARMHLGKQWGVLPSDNLINKLKECSEHISFQLDYV